MKTRAEITKVNTTAGQRYLASLVNGDGFEEVLIASKQFRTLKGARLWVNRKRARPI
jgi:hypothetical protein